jgi:hypothetical protein
MTLTSKEHGIIQANDADVTSLMVVMDQLIWLNGGSKSRKFSFLGRYSITSYGYGNGKCSIPHAN